MGNQLKEATYGCTIVIGFAFAVVTGLFGRGVHLLCADQATKGMVTQTIQR